MPNFFKNSSLILHGTFRMKAFIRHYFFPFLFFLLLLIGIWCSPSTINFPMVGKTTPQRSSLFMVISLWYRAFDAEGKSTWISLFPRLPAYVFQQMKQESRSNSTGRLCRAEKTECVFKTFLHSIYLVPHPLTWAVFICYFDWGMVRISTF